MRFLSHIQSLAVCCVLLGAQFCSGDLVVSTVEQYAEATVGGLTLGELKSDLPIIAFSVPNTPGGTDFSEAEHILVQSYVGPSSVGSDWAGPLNVAVTTDTSATSGTGTLADSFATFELIFTLSEPRDFTLSYDGTVVNGSNQDNLFEFKRTDAAGVNYSGEGNYGGSDSGTLDPGTYRLYLESISTVFGSAGTASAFGNASLNLAAVPEPSAFLLVGLLAAVGGCGAWIRKRLSRSAG